MEKEIKKETVRFVKRAIDKDWEWDQLIHSNEYRDFTKYREYLKEEFLKSIIEEIWNDFANNGLEYFDKKYKEYLCNYNIERDELLTKLSSFGVVEVLSEGKSLVFMMTGKGFENMKTLLSIGNLVSDYAEKIGYPYIEFMKNSDSFICMSLISE